MKPKFQKSKSELSQINIFNTKAQISKKVMKIPLWQWYFLYCTKEMRIHTLAEISSPMSDAAK